MEASCPYERMVNLTALCSFACHLQAIFFTQHYILYPEEPVSTDIPTSIIKPSDTLILPLTPQDDDLDDSLLDADDNESLGSAPPRP